MLVAALVLPAIPVSAAGTWTPLTHQPPAFLDSCKLLTNGDVMCHQYNSNKWHRLTPDVNGSYRNGTWNTPPIAPMPNGVDPSFGCNGCVYAPTYFASAVLPDGQVVVIGGEYVSLNAVWTNIGFLYNPVTNTWSTQLNEKFGGGRIGDSSGICLEDGTFVLSDILSGNLESLNPATLAFTKLNPPGKLDKNNEETWNILPDGRIFTVNTFIVSSFESYDSVSNSWGDSGATPVNLPDCCGAPVGNSKEIGPAVLRPDGKLIYFTGNSLGKNAVYDSNTGLWSHTAAMDFPLVAGQTYHYGVADGPASLLPNGNVLVMASPVRNGAPFNAPAHFWEFDGTTLTQTVDTPNSARFTSYQGRMLLLPTGEVLLAAFDQQSVQDVMLYTNGGSPQKAWAPKITSSPDGTIQRGQTYSISGKQFNGFSEGATYGDDDGAATNYPLVRITNVASGHVTYARTHDHSRMGVEKVGSTEIVTTQFTVPAGTELGESSLVVVANGIASERKRIQVAP